MQLDDIVEQLEKITVNLDPDLLPVAEARTTLASCVRAERLLAYLKTSLATRIDDAAELARVAGTSIGKARETVATGKVLEDSAPLSEALKHGDISFDQASEIAKAEESAPGAATKLVAVAKKEPFHALKEKARAIKLEAERHKDLAQRQSAARCARSYADELGMMHVYLSWEPHVGTPIVARAEAEAQRLARAAKKTGSLEPFERHLADAYAKLLSGSGKGRAKRPELVLLVSHEVAKRGWKDVADGELCKIPGVGPVAPSVAKEVAQDAFLNGVFYDGRDLRQFARWSRNIPVEVTIALELGDPPSSMGSDASTAGTASGPSSTTSSRAQRSVPPPTATSIHVAGAAIKRKRGATAKPES